MRRLLFLTSAIVFFDTLFFTALTPLLPHYARSLGLGKAGAGVLAASYPAGCLISAIPSGSVATRLGAKPTVIAGLTVVACCTVLFGIATTPWELDVARFAQGFASAFTWTGALTWLVAATPVSRRGQTIGNAFAAASAGALFGPVLGAIASQAGVRATFVVVGIGSLGLALWALLSHAERPEAGQPASVLLRAMRTRGVLLGCWFVTLAALCFGTLGVLAPLWLSAIGVGTVAIGATFLAGAAGETGINLVIGRIADRHGALLPLRVSLVGALLVSLLLAIPAHTTAVVVVLVIIACVAFGMFFTPGMTVLMHGGDAAGVGFGYSVALVNMAWAPGQALGAAGGGALAHLTSNAVPYLLLAGVCALTLAGLWRRSTVSMMRSARVSSAQSLRTTGAD
ncbi:MAG TPA: MFS transporter [Gaiellaceae bacterium]|nr:MFS transporter [Gaiellaceae bacterium]